MLNATRFIDLAVVRSQEEAVKRDIERKNVVSRNRAMQIYPKLANSKEIKGSAG